jgi:hypothetical protein
VGVPEWKTIRVPETAWKRAKEQKEKANRTWAEQVIRPSEDGIGIVYTLNEPDSGDPRYVGATSQHPEQRLKQHMMLVGGNERLHDWKKSLKESGEKPEMEAVRFVELEQLNEAEKEVREQLQKEHELLNGNSHNPTYNWDTE